MHRLNAAPTCPFPGPENILMYLVIARSVEVSFTPGCFHGFAKYLSKESLTPTCAQGGWIWLVNMDSGARKSS